MPLALLAEPLVTALASEVNSRSAISGTLNPHSVFSANASCDSLGMASSQEHRRACRSVSSATSREKREAGRSRLS